MDKVIIYGTYHFIGFNLCKKLLDEGIQVVGYRLFENDEEGFLEEKKLLIGRNANFEERLLSNEEMLVEEKSIFVISFYDLYFSEFENTSSNYEDFFVEIQKQCKSNENAKLVCLFPHAYIEGLPKFLQDQLSLMKEIPIQSIYLPTVYGPWQSNKFLFQQSLLKDYLNIIPKYEKKENTTDAIYINDIINEIIRIMDDADSINVLFQSKNGEQWKKGAQYLQLEYDFDLNEMKKEIRLNDDMKIIKINESVSIQEGLDIQKKHLSTLLFRS
jgi:nucleoside-diphosphate-sugar epimerase